MKNLKLSTKIMTTFFVSLTVLSLVVAGLYPLMYKSLMDEKRAKTQNLVETAWASVNYYAEQAKAGVLSEEEAKNRAIATVKSMRYMENNYFWITIGTTMVMHPIKASLDGKDLGGLKDANGKYLFAEMEEVCKKDGAGYVDYLWPKPGEEEASAKVSYVKAQKDWNWIVGTGIYVDDVRQQLNSKFGAVFGGIALVIIVTLFVAVLVTRSIIKPLTNAIADINSGSSQVEETATQVASSSQLLAEGTTEQASALEETSSSLEELSAMTRQNAGNAQEVNVLMDDAKDTVVRSSKSMQKLTDSMSVISSASEETQKIIKTIDEIAFQTNLASINAAVEAARAGEAGAGFAVVADEVRNLAMRAAEAAQSTGELIDNSVSSINEGRLLVDQCNSDFAGVAENSEKVAVLVNEIATAAQEQAEGISQINQAITEMDKVTQNNAAGSEETAAASEELDVLADQLKRTVGDLQKVVEGAAAEQGYAARPAARQVQGQRVYRPVQSSQKVVGKAEPQKIIPFDDFKDDDFEDFAGSDAA